MEKLTTTITTLGSMPSTPTTFVQADTHTFRELVQKLTGVTEDSSEKLPITVPARFSGRVSGDVPPRRSAFKLHERRQSMRKLEIKLGLTSLRNSGGFSPRSPGQQLISPTISDLIPSPVTPLGSDPFENPSLSGYCYRNSSPISGCGSESSFPAVSEEERAIAEKGFYLHPSPLNTPRGSEPELLPLFPLSSPKQSNP